MIHRSSVVEKHTTNSSSATKKKKEKISPWLQVSLLSVDRKPYEEARIDASPARASTLRSCLLSASGRKRLTTRVGLEKGVLPCDTHI